MGTLENLYKKQLDLYQKMKEYDCCEHVVVYSEVEHDAYEGRTYRSYGCIKCGLDDSVSKRDRKYLSDEQKVMYDYLSERAIRGRDTKISCDLDLAQAIYSKIKQIHPNIPDDVAIKYFEIALGNIRDIKVSEERKQDRAKRLSLNPEFKNWNGSDVHY